MKKIISILAVDDDWGIGKHGDIPWQSDLKNFKDITTHTEDTDKQNVVIMGKNTWESIPEKFRPFSNRVNYIISKSIKKDSVPDGVEIFSSLHEAILHAQHTVKIETIFLIGGAWIYQESFQNNLNDEIYVTKIPWAHECDTFVDINYDEYEICDESEIPVWTHIYKLLKYKKLW